MPPRTSAIARLTDAVMDERISRREAFRRAAGFGAAGALAAALSARGGGRSALAGESTPPSGEPIKIGASISTTGSNGRTGIYLQEAYLLWQEQKNAIGGVLGRPVEMIIYDDRSDPTTGARLYERLLTEDEVDLILGPYSSSVTEAVVPVTERAGQPMLAAGAASGELWNRGYQYLFGVFSVAEDFFKDIVLTIAPAQGYTTAAIVHEDTLFPISAAKGAAAHCETAGIEVLVYEAYPQDATDVSAILTRVRDENPDMLIGGAYLPDSVLVTRQAKELELNPKLFAFSVGAAQPEFVELLGADAEYVLGPAMWEPEIETPGNADFVAAYLERWEREPAYFSADAYTACQVLEAAVTQVGSVDDLDAIRDALLALEMPTILPGVFKVDETGRMIGHIPLTVQWQGGQKIIVAPDGVATGSLNLPTPPWDQRA